MKTRSLVLFPVALALTWPLLAQETFTLQWKESGVKEKISSYRPNAVRLSNDAPAVVKKAPADLKAARYGSFKVGPAKAPATIVLAVEDKDGKPSRLFVDANGNGDLTDDPAHEWTERRARRANATNDSVSYHSDATVVIPFISGPRRAHVMFYSFGNAEGMSPAARTSLFYYSDYGFAGEVRIGGRAIPALLEDSGVTGDLRLSSETMRNPLLWLDLDGDGKAGARGEITLASRPFEVDGKWWAMTNLTPEGSFQIVVSAKPVQTERPAGPDLSPGQKASSFAGKLVTGKTVKFPEDYKGKVVMLDFWATWCGPCVAEIPNVVEAYQKFHPKGFEILGISLDRENAEQKVIDFAKQREMPWPQVYDGKFWQAEVAKLYGIRAIPHMLLVDGDTGTILANNVRGERLAPAIEKALAGKKK